MKMKTLAIVAISGALASPALTFAQTSYEQQAPVTRAQVRDELVQIEQAGYQPALADNAHYPDSIQAAEARVSGQQGDAQLTNNAMGGVPEGSYAAGGPAGGTYRPSYPSSYGSQTSYGAPGCTGPASFCDIYSGGGR